MTASIPIWLAQTSRLTTNLAVFAKLWNDAYDGVRHAFLKKRLDILHHCNGGLVGADGLLGEPPQHRDLGIVIAPMLLLSVITGVSIPLPVVAIALLGAGAPASLRNGRAAA